MKKLFILFTIIVFPAIVCAQTAVPAEFNDYAVKTEITPGKLMVLGNTINNKALLLYEVIDDTLGTVSVYSVNINQWGVAQNHYLVASNIDAPGLWHATWHPDVGRYQLIFRKDLALMTQIVRSNSRPKGRAKKVVDYNYNRMYITWTMNKRYVVFYEDETSMQAQALRKNGRNFKSSKKMAGGDLTGDAYPSGATTEADGTAICYFCLYTSLESDALTMSILKTNDRLKKIDQFAISEPIDVESRKNFRGLNDLYSGNHFITWSFQVPEEEEVITAFEEEEPPTPEPKPQYAIYGMDGASIMEAEVIPDEREPWSLGFTNDTERFAILFSWTEDIVPAATKTNFAVMLFKPNGILVSPGNTILEEERAAVDKAVGAYTNFGDYVLIWSIKSGDHRGIYSRIFF